ncbi:putative diguanylate cyclase YdaM [Roseibium album]|nr:putative diguanylate cyclase YdaM [Roseibium album]
MRNLDWSAKGWPRVYIFTALGTSVCIAVAFAVDSFSLSTMTWRWGSDPINNLVIPLLVAPPFFLLLLSKMRQLLISQHELAKIASTDSLTSLFNRRAFTENVEGYTHRMEQASNRSSNALLVIDVDHFKMINDSYGHDEGDKALKMIAETIGSGLCKEDLTGRLGGEEFGVFIPNRVPEYISEIAEQIRFSITQIEFLPKGRRHRLSISVGGIIFKEYTTFQELYKKADELLYFAKSNGRNRVELSTFAPGISD